MPTTITTAVTTVKNAVPQNLFTIGALTTIPTDPAQVGATTFSTIASPATVTFDTTLNDIGTDITFASSSLFTLAGSNVANIAYNLSASVDVAGAPGFAQPVTYGWVNTTSGNVIGTVAPIGTPVSTTYLNNTGANVTVAVRVFNYGAEPFSYPAQVVNASAIVTAVSGYEVA
jgi:hypothetical protein